MGRRFEGNVTVRREDKTGYWQASYHVRVLGEDGRATLKRERPSLRAVAVAEGLDPARMSEADALRLAQKLAAETGAAGPEQSAGKDVRDRGAELRERREARALPTPAASPAPMPPPQAPRAVRPLPTPEELLREVEATLRARGEHGAADAVRRPAGVERVEGVLAEAAERRRADTSQPRTPAPEANVAPPPAYDWIRAPEAAALLGVSLRKVYRMVDAGELPHLTDPLRFDRARLVAWIEGRMAANTPATAGPAEPLRGAQPRPSAAVGPAPGSGRGGPRQS